MAYGRRRRFDTDFEAWLDTKVLAIRSDARHKYDRVRRLWNDDDDGDGAGPNTGAGSLTVAPGENAAVEFHKNAVASSNSESAVASSSGRGGRDETSVASNNSSSSRGGRDEVTADGISRPNDIGAAIAGDICSGIVSKADDICLVADDTDSSGADDFDDSEQELIEDEWDAFVDGGGMSHHQATQLKQRGAVEDDFQAGGAFYTTVYGLEDDDGEEAAETTLGQRPPPTPSARERVAKILRETELHDNVSTGNVQQQQQHFRFEPVSIPAGKMDFGPGIDDDWSLEEEPPVALDPRRLLYIHREAGDGKEAHAGRPIDARYRSASSSASSPTSKTEPGTASVDRGSEVDAGSLEEYMDAQENLDEDEIDIRTPTGKGRALLPMEEMELSFDEEESDENILDVEEEYGGTVSIRDTQPIIMDEEELQRQMTKKRFKIKVGVVAFVVVTALAGFALVAYLTVHLLST